MFLDSWITEPMGTGFDEHCVIALSVDEDESLLYPWIANVSLYVSIDADNDTFLSNSVSASYAIPATHSNHNSQTQRFKKEGGTRGKRKEMRTFWLAL